MKIMQYFRHNNLPYNTLTSTQYIHEMVHRLESWGFNISDGSRGKPSFPADKDAAKAIAETAIALYENDSTSPYGKYSIGEYEYRKKAANGFKNEYGIEFHPEQIIFTPGGQFGISATFYAIEKLNPHSKIIAPSPWYVNHHELANMFSGERICETGCGENKFIKVDLLTSPEKRLNAGVLQKALDENKNEKIGAFLFCNPSNPLSQVTRYNEWLEIAKILDKYPETPIVMDEAFAEIIFDNDEKWSLLHAAPHLAERTFLMRSGTKALGLSGERLAVMVVPKKYVPIITSLQSRLIGNAPLTSQAGMAEAMITMTPQKKKKISDYYAKNCEYIHGEMKKLGILLDDNIKPEGGFYMLVNLSQLIGKKIPEAALEFIKKDNNLIENDVDIALSLMFGLLQPEKEGIALVPASFFGVDANKGILRISYSPNINELTKLVERLKKVLNNDA
jgi:aspartate/methionine/tyrosine aminotransferase